jgi:hypothetical protein
MKDRMVYGAIAGAAGGVLQEIYGYLLKVYDLTDRGFIDFGRAVILYEVKDGALEIILAIISHLTLSLLLGILFAYIVKNASHELYYAKAFIYGLSTWFILHAAGTALRLPMFFNIPSPAALATLIGAFLYSFSLAYLLKIFSTKK